MTPNHIFKEENQVADKMTQVDFDHQTGLSGFLTIVFS